MWGNTSRRNAELEARNAYLQRALDKARGTTLEPAKVEPDWEKLAKQYAEDRVTAAREDAKEMARLQDVAEGWAKLARADERRSLRLARAVTRYWVEIGKLRKAVAERDATAAERDATIAELQDRLGGDRAIKAPVPRKDPAATEIRQLKAQVAALDAQLQILEKANAAQDVRRPSLQKAS